MIWRKLVICASTCLLTACVQHHSKPAGLKGDVAVITPIMVNIMPSTLGQDVFIVQKVEGQFAGRRDVLRFDIEILNNILTMVATTNVGLPAFSITYNGEVPEVVRYMTGISLPPVDWILSDFLIAHTPEDNLRMALNVSGYDLQTTPQSRTVLNAQGQTVITVTYVNADMQSLWRDFTLHNDILGYRLTVQVLETGRAVH